MLMVAAMMMSVSLEVIRDGCDDDDDKDDFFCFPSLSLCSLFFFTLS